MADPYMQEPGAEEGAGGFCVKLYVGADGAMSIGVEQGMPPDDEEGPAMQPVASAREAMEVIMDLIKNQGQVSDAAGEEAEMEAGFAGEPAQTLPGMM